MKTLVIIGASGHAKVVADIVLRQEGFRLLGFLDDGKEEGEEVMVGRRVLGLTGDLASIAPDTVLVAIGDNAVRERVVQKIGDVPFATAIHPAASIAHDAEIGAGSVLMAGAIINPSSRVGQHCILNTNSSLDHDSVMGDFASLAPGAVTGGNCRIGRSSAISIGAIIKHGLMVGADSVVGAGSVVLSDVPPLTVCYGSPARVIRNRQHGDRYL